jgi:hypothetical protein
MNGKRVDDGVGYFGGWPLIIAIAAPPAAPTILLLLR